MDGRSEADQQAERASGTCECEPSQWGQQVELTDSTDQPTRRAVMAGGSGGYKRWAEQVAGLLTASVTCHCALGQCATPPARANCTTAERVRWLAWANGCAGWGQLATLVGGPSADRQLVVSVVGAWKQCQPAMPVAGAVTRC